MIQKLLDTISISGESRGSSEAVSQAILFFVMIVLTATVGGVGGDVIADVEDEQALDQSVRGFIDAHEKATTFSKTGAANEFTTSGKITKTKLLDAKLTDRPTTRITISTRTDTYQLESTPLMIEHNDFRVFYDTGVVSSVEYGTDRKTVHWSPIDNERSNDGVLPLTTMETSSDIREKGELTRLYLNQSQTAESITVTDGDTITVDTATPHGWEDYLSSYSFLTDPTVTESGGRKVIEADITSSSDTVLIHHEKVSLRPL